MEIDKSCFFLCGHGHAVLGPGDMDMQVAAVKHVVEKRRRGTSCHLRIPLFQ